MTFRSEMRHIESSTQINCVRWFRLQYPAMARLLVSIPNGGYRNRVTAAIMKAEGTVAGAPDLFLFQPSNGYHGLAIEMKTEKGRQQPSQRLWQQDAEKAGYRYVICRSVEDFIAKVREYLYIRG